MPRPEYDIHLDEAEANLVLQGLGELPTKLGYNLVTRVAQVIATTNKAWQDTQQPAGLTGTPPAASMVGLQALEEPAKPGWQKRQEDLYPPDNPVAQSQG